jgi:hypothetical protein
MRLLEEEVARTVRKGKPCELSTNGNKEAQILHKRTNSQRHRPNWKLVTGFVRLHFAANSAAYITTYWEGLDRSEVAAFLFVVFLQYGSDFFVLLSSFRWNIG